MNIIIGGIMEKGDDVLTTLLGGCVGLVVLGIGIILILSWIFG
jgi:hypothetical protein